jgi:anaphase-promoting complex subunit 4
VSLVSAQTGRSVHQINFDKTSTAQISKLYWSLNVTEAASLRARVKGSVSTIDLGKVFTKDVPGLKSSATVDLPRELAFLDVESILPKLSTLPAGVKE